MSKPGRKLERASWLPGPCSSRSPTAALRSLPEWTVPTFLDGAGPLTRSELVHRQVDGRMVPEAAASATVDGLRPKGLLAPTDEAHGAGLPGALSGGARLSFRLHRLAQIEGRGNLKKRRQTDEQERKQT